MALRRRSRSLSKPPHRIVGRVVASVDAAAAAADGSR
jgi:hypothetical protein